MSTRKPRAARPVPAPKKGPGRPPKSDFDKAMDRVRADYLSLAFDYAAKKLAAMAEERGIKIPARDWKAYLIARFASERHKSVATVRDMMKPERRVLRTKRRRASV